MKQKLGDLLHQYGLNMFEKYGLNVKFSTSEEVFERFVMGLFDGMVRTEILEKVKPTLFQKISEPKAVQLYGELSRVKFREEMIGIFRAVGMAGLFPWDRMADGIWEITKLSKEFNGLGNLYPSLLKEYKNPKVARHNLLKVILDVPGISNKKALVLLRDLHYQCDWNYPIADLPLPVDTHVRVVLERMGYVKGKKGSATDLEIQSAAKTYFKIPLITDLAIWDIGKRFCPKKGQPKCNKCPAHEYCEYPLQNK